MSEIESAEAKAAIMKWHLTREKAARILRRVHQVHEDTKEKIRAYEDLDTCEGDELEQWTMLNHLELDQRNVEDETLHNIVEMGIYTMGEAIHAMMQNEEEDHGTHVDFH